MRRTISIAACGHSTNILVTQFQLLKRRKTGCQDFSELGKAFWFEGYECKDMQYVSDCRIASKRLAGTKFSHDY
jgi:hypothetical protein